MTTVSKDEMMPLTHPLYLPDKHAISVTNNAPTPPLFLPA